MPSVDPTAQDVIDALRIAFMAQSDDAEVAKLARALVDFAPETDNDRGIQFLLELIAEGNIKVSLYEPHS